MKSFEKLLYTPGDKQGDIDAQSCVPAQERFQNAPYFHVQLALDATQEKLKPWSKEVKTNRI